jgi:hypothetical protein
VPNLKVVNYKLQGAYDLCIVLLFYVPFVQMCNCIVYYFLNKRAIYNYQWCLLGSLFSTPSLMWVGGLSAALGTRQKNVMSWRWNSHWSIVMLFWQMPYIGPTDKCTGHDTHFRFLVKAYITTFYSSHPMIERSNCWKFQNFWVWLDPSSGTSYQKKFSTRVYTQQIQFGIKP